jgi:thiol-disulfide isomerase/thioredoxin
MENVAYLEVEDFDSNGNLKPHVGNGKPVVLMGKANFCGYCTKAEPAFAQFAKSHPNIVAATIISDGEASEKAAGKFFKKWDSAHRGVPAYFGFSSNGKYKGVHGGGRDVAALKTFSASL